MPVDKWIVVDVDAGRYRNTWWGAFLARRYTEGWKANALRNDSEALLEWQRKHVKEAARRGQIFFWPGEDGAITPAEGIAAIYAFCWITGELDRGAINADEPVYVRIDNSAVLSKVQSHNTRGKYKDVWKRLAESARAAEAKGTFAHMGSEAPRTEPTAWPAPTTSPMRGPSRGHEFPISPHVALPILSEPY